MISCPLCCSSAFKTKALLIDHLTEITNNIVCPICSVNISSIDGLIDHLKSSNCIETIVFNITKNQLVQQSDYNSETISTENEKTSNSTEVIESNMEDISEVNALYTEILNKQHIQELRIVKDCGDKYVIIDDKGSVINTGTTFVSTQNEDGTISYRIEEAELPIEQEGELVAKVEEESQDSIEESEEIYSCNTCSMTFSCVLDHINQYHTDQNVVVEDLIDNTATQEHENYNEDSQGNSHLISEEIVQDMAQENLPVNQKAAKQVKPKQSKNKKCFVRLEMVDKSNISENGDSKEQLIEKDSDPTYHKVVIKTLHTDDKKKTVYSCMYCNLVVSSLAEFKQLPCTLSTDTNGPPKYTCTVCSIGYDNPKSLCAHMKVHKEKPSADCVSAARSTKSHCEVCNTWFPTIKALKLHRRMHYPIKPRPIQLPVGSSGPKDTETFVCPICKKEIPVHYRLIHQNSHNMSDDLTCDICNKKFPTRELLEMHTNVHNMYKITTKKTENEELRYQCLYCARKFSKPHEKVKHERIHTGEKPHVCEICGKSFRVSYCLTLHMRTHTGARPYECPHCPKRFKAHSVYHHHILSHSDVRAYKCPFCPKSFKTSVQLAGHKNSHTKPFQCQICNRPFASLYAVRLHMEVHSRMNSLKFKCTECGASYARAFALKDHVKQAHSHIAANVDNMVEQKEGKIIWDANLDETEGIESQDNEINELNSAELIIN